MRDLTKNEAEDVAGGLRGVNFDQSLKGVNFDFDKTGASTTTTPTPTTTATVSDNPIIINRGG